MTTTSLNRLLNSWDIELASGEVHCAKVLRHASNETDVPALYRHGLTTLESYQQFQSEPVFDGCDRLISFIGTANKTATFVGIYNNLGRIGRSHPGFIVPAGPPELLTTLSSANYLYTLIRDTRFDEFRDKLCISWGDSPKQWHQWLPDNDKEIVSSDSLAIAGTLPSQRNPAWSRDELILALDLYLRFPPLSLNASHSEVVELSKLLNDLGVRLGRVQTEKFRNPNGVSMTLLNFLRFDPTYSGAGLTRGGKLQEEIWNRFNGDRAALSLIAATIRSGVHDASELLSEGTVGDEDSFPEGTVLYRMHRTRERNSEAIRMAVSVA